MENKIYTEDDLHSLIGKAIQSIETGLTLPDLNLQFDAAVRFLQMPVVSAILRAQEAKSAFPQEIDLEDHRRPKNNK